MVTDQQVRRLICGRGCCCASVKTLASSAFLSIIERYHLRW
jgi:hypothetical protein